MQPEETSETENLTKGGNNFATVDWRKKIKLL